MLAASIVATTLRRNRQRVVIKQFAPAVIHQHFATWAGGRLDAAARMGAPVVTTLHGYDVFAARGKSTDLLAGEAMDAGFPADRIAVHYQGVDSDYVTPAENSGSRRATHIVFVGALETRKDVDDLIMLSNRLVGTGMRLRVIGVGSRRVARGCRPGALGAASMRNTCRHVCERRGTGDGCRRAVGVVVPKRDAVALADAAIQLSSLDANEHQMWADATRRFVVEERSLASSARGLSQHYRRLAHSEPA